MTHYEEFLASKRVSDPSTGVTRRIELPEYLKPHQRDITNWSLRRGRSAIFAGTGLGKTLMELVWAKEVAAETRRPVLILAPLAVSHQHAREGDKFGISATVVSSPSSETIDITNYQKVDRFDLSEFGGVALDESSILKNTEGKYRSKLIHDCASVPFRLAATATPAPNDFMELGNHAEFLGVFHPRWRGNSKVAPQRSCRIRFLEVDGVLVRNAADAV
jgi:superfamily II DNA or RNA helicase